MALNTNLVSYWKLEDTSDSVGSNTLTNNNSVSFVSPGIFGSSDKCADLGSSNTNKYLSNSLSCGYAGSAYSMSFWIKLNSEISSGAWGLIQTGDGISKTGLNVSYLYNSGTRQLQWDRHIMGGSDNSFTSNITLGTSNWYHIVLVYDGSKVYGYVNGTQVGSVSSSGNGSSDDGYRFKIGLTDRGTSYPSCKIDETAVWSRALTSGEITQLYNSGLGNQYPFGEGLSTSIVAYYKLDESSGNASDATGNGRTLTNANVTYQSGKINNGALFNSITDILYTTSYSPFDFERNETFSISAWVKYNSFTGNQWLVSHQQGIGTGWSIYTNNSGSTSGYRISFIGTNGTSIIVDSATNTLSLNTWYHIVMTYDGTSSASGIKLYINGSNVSLSINNDNLSASIKNTRYFEIGNRDDNSGTGWNNDGMIDEFGVWNRVLSSSDVTSLYNSGSGNQYPFAQNIVLAVATGIYTLTGQDITLGRAIILSMITGMYSLTGSIISITSTLHTIWTAKVINPTYWRNKLTGN